MENLKEQIVELAAHLGENQLVRADKALQAAQVELYRAPFDGSGGGGGGGKRGRWLNSGENVGGSFRSLGKSFKRVFHLLGCCGMNFIRARANDRAAVVVAVAGRCCWLFVWWFRLLLLLLLMFALASAWLREVHNFKGV